MRPNRLLTLAASFAVAALFVTGAAALNINDDPPPRGQVGVPYSFKFRLDVGSGTEPIKWRILSGSFPPGLSMSEEGTVSGTPQRSGTFTFYVEAEDSMCCPFLTQEERSITITDRLFVATTGLPDAAINQPYSQQLTASGGTVSAWSVVGGSPPPGVTVSPTGVVSGTPTAAGQFGFTVQASGSTNNDTKQLGLFVLAPVVLGGPTGAAPASEPIPLNGKVNTPFAWGVRASGGRGQYTYTSSALPTGLTLNADGTLTGTPTTAGATTITFTVTDAAGTDTLTATLNVKALLAFSQIVRPRVGVLDRFYSWRIPVTGASKTRIFVASGKFPPGLDLDEATGVFSGFPLRAGSYRLKVWVLGDSGTQIFRSYTIKITR